MIKKAQKGWAATETILILVIVALIAFVAWYAFHTKSTTDNTYNNAGNTQLNPPQSSTKKSTNSNTTTASIIQIKSTSSTGGGQYLADGSGKTLYTFTHDTNGISNCSGTCADNWPAYKATITSNLPSNVSTITRADGTKQYTYKGMPLYYYVGDTSPGQITGNNVNDFVVAKP